jgi:Methylamine utilisation protein MauE
VQPRDRVRDSRSRETADVRSAAASLIEFGAPARKAVPAARLLACSEVAIAVALFPSATSAVAAALAVGLFIVFAASMAKSLARGRRPPCRCFGRLSNGSSGWLSVARSLALAALAALVGVGPSQVTGWREGPSDGSAWKVLPVLFAGSALLFAGLALLVLRRHGRLLLSLHHDSVWGGEAPSEHREGMRLGTRAPPFQSEAVTGGRVSLDDLLAAGGWLLLLLIDARCATCETALAEIATWRRVRPELTLAVAGAGAPDELRSLQARHGVDRMLIDTLGVSERYGVRQTPSTVHIDGDGVVGAWATGTAAITDLVANQADTARLLQPGDRFPILSGPGELLDGLRDHLPAFVVFAGSRLWRVRRFRRRDSDREAGEGDVAAFRIPSVVGPRRASG